MITTVQDRTDFAISRDNKVTQAAVALSNSVRRALRRFRTEGWYTSLVNRAVLLARRSYREEVGKAGSPTLTKDIGDLRDHLTRMMEATTDPSANLDASVERIARSMATAAMNTGLLAAAHDHPNQAKLGKVWLSMDDDKVRPTHRVADGQLVGLDEKFHVDGVEMVAPGDLSAPIQEWVNCRCVMGIEFMDMKEAVRAAGTGEGMAEDESMDAGMDPMAPQTPWHGVLAPEGVLSGDGRKFGEGSLRWRDLPLPLSYQKVNAEGHDGSVVVGRIDNVWRKDGQLRGKGSFLATPEADEAVGMLAEGAIRGVSVDADDGTMQMELRDGTPLDDALEASQDGIPIEDVITVFTDARVCGATLCAIPAFQEAFVAIGEPPDDFGPDEADPAEAEPDNDPDDVTAHLDMEEELERAFAVSEKPCGVRFGRAYTSDGTSVAARNRGAATGVLAMDGRGDQVTAAWPAVRVHRRADTGWREEASSPSCRLGEYAGSDPSGPDCGSPVQEPSVLQPGAHGTGHGSGEHSPRHAGDATVSAAGDVWVWAPVHRGEHVLAEQPSEGWFRVQGASVSSLSEAVLGGSEVEGIAFRAISEKAWDGSSSRFTNEQWCRSTLISLENGCTNKAEHKLPILEPNGALSRAAVHNATARLNQTQAPAAQKSKAAAALRSAYRTLNEDVPDALKASAFARGPGWITHPKETKRIHDYWTKPGEAGYAKINWGHAGDFNRCRVEVGEEIGENSPAKTRFINQICAQWHHDALGIWPGRPVSGDTIDFVAASGEAVHLVEITPETKPPGEWFTDPHLTGPSPIVVTEDRRIFGHLATWGTCHIGLDGVCTTPPVSETNYAYFRTGAVLTQDGEVAVGNITMDTGHAEGNCSARVAVGHYDNTGYCVASVAAGEDEYGIWVAGWVPPEVSEDKVRALRSVVLSGDWRRIGPSLELVAALAVPVGGFPIPRTQLAASGGRQISLVAANIVPRPKPQTQLDVEAIVSETLRQLAAKDKRAAAMSAMHAAVNKKKMAALAAGRN